MQSPSEVRLMKISITRHLDPGTHATEGSSNVKMNKMPDLARRTSLPVQHSLKCRAHAEEDVSNNKLWISPANVAFISQREPCTKVQRIKLDTNRPSKCNKPSFFCQRISFHYGPGHAITSALVLAGQLGHSSAIPTTNVYSKSH